MASGPLTMVRVHRGHPALVYVVSLDLLPWAVILKKLTGVAVLYDSSEHYDEYMMTKEYLPLRLRRVLRRLVFHIEPWLASKLDGATTAVPVTQKKFSDAGVRSVLVRNLPLGSLADLSARRGQFTHDILVGGSLHHDGVTVLARTAAELKAAGFSETTWLAVCRNYGERDKQALERALADAGVRDQFELRYDLPFTEVQELTARARVGFIGYPERPYYRIALPIRVFEYMAVGLPFVTADYPMVADLVRSDEVGVLSPPGDAYAYAAALGALLNDPERQARMTERGPRLVRERYNWDAEARKLLELVGDVVGPR